MNTVTAAPEVPGAPETFAFTPENRAEAERIIAKYPPGKQASAVLPLLDLAQRQQGGWLPRAAMEHVGELLDMAPIRVYEVATFYTMFNLTPIGRHHVRVCVTPPCSLRGADEVMAACEAALGVRCGETTADGSFTLSEVECLGACVNAPIVWIGEDYYEDLDPAAITRVLEALKRGETPRPGSQAGRRSSEPAGGLTTLTSAAKD